MFEKFTERAKRVLFLARYEASQLGGQVIGTEHLLLGLLKEQDDITREIFSRLNTDMELLRTIRSLLRGGQGPPLPCGYNASDR